MQILDSTASDPSQEADQNYMILLRSKTNHCYRALYSYNIKLNLIMKLHGQGPEEVQLGTHYFKYDSGTRCFRELPTREFGRSMHGFSL